MNAENPEGKLLEAVRQASARWISAFNSGNAAGCAAQYEESALMQARPLGTFSGREEIQAFWTKLIGEGYAGVEYLDPRIEPLSDSTAVLTSRWTMNKARGVIHKELWALQSDGTAKLREDDFEVTG